MKGRVDVVVVGAGIFGAAGALELGERGYSVCLIDPGPLPHPRASSTDISKVIRMEYGADEFYLRAMKRALTGWREWNSRWERTLFHETGVLVLTSSPMRPGTFEADSFEMLKKHAQEVERLDAAQIAKRHPAWAPGAYCDGYFNPQGGWAEAGQVVLGIIEAAKQAGVEVLEGAPVISLNRVGERVTGVKMDREDLSAGSVVVAAGAWTPSLLPELAGHMWPVAQPVFHFRAPRIEAFQPPGFTVWIADVASTGWYGFPALADGTLKIANHGPGLRLPPAAEVDATQGREADFRRFMARSLPGLSDAPVLHKRTCYYADTWDGDFYITAVPGQEGLFLASGGSGHAFKFAPLLGGWIADCVQGRVEHRPARFAWRTPDERRTEDARFLEG